MPCAPPGQNALNYRIFVLLIQCSELRRNGRHAHGGYAARRSVLQTISRPGEGPNYRCHPLRGSTLTEGAHHYRTATSLAWRKASWRSGPVESGQLGPDRSPGISADRYRCCGCDLRPLQVAGATHHTRRWREVPGSQAQPGASTALQRPPASAGNLSRSTAIPCRSRPYRRPAPGDGCGLPA